MKNAYFNVKTNLTSADRVNATLNGRMHLASRQVRANSGSILAKALINNPANCPLFATAEIRYFHESRKNTRGLLNLPESPGPQLAKIPSEDNPLAF